MKIIRKPYSLQSLNIFRGCHLKIGILGGSFNPAHEGHLLISKTALNSLGFDYVIWLVALQNPFKTNYNEDIFTRAKEALIVANHPRIIVSTAESDIGSQYTVQSLETLTSRFSNIDFTWLMGADNLASFHKWHRYEKIMELCKIIVFDRPGYNNYFSTFSQKFNAVVAKSQSADIILFRGIMSKISSSEIRQRENDKNY
jgi:nicotinate-nucleotide adenylyltransferase